MSSAQSSRYVLCVLGDPHLPPEVGLLPLSLCWLGIHFPLSVLQTDEDYYPVLLLTELLSRTEGPLWEKIRGRGYAYGADIFFAPSWGHLWSSIHESSSPAEVVCCPHSLRTPRRYISIPTT